MKRLWKNICQSFFNPKVPKVPKSLLFKREKTFVVFPSLTYWELDGKPVSSRTALRAMANGIQFNGDRLKLKPTEIALHPEQFC